MAMTASYPSVKMLDMAAIPAHGPYLVLGYSKNFSVYVGGEGHKGTCL